MEFIYLSFGFAVGAIIVFFLLSGKLKKLETKNVLSNQQLAHEQEIGTQLQAERDRLQCEQAEQQQQLITIKLELERVTTQLESEQASHSKETEMRREQFEQQQKTVQEQFSNLATRILEQTSERLKTTNNESMEHLTKPLKMNIEQLQQAIQHTNTETSKNTASLSQQLREMSLQTQKIESTATRLTNVIRGGNKAQGNWGERILTDILESQGYKLGIDYDIQHTLTDEKGNVIKNDDTGRRMIPDVILHYPNNEDVIIDSKMSIDAYYQYVNTEEEALKKKFAADLVSSIRAQATSLAKKDYGKYVHSPRKAIDFVIMFVPNEGALQLALDTEPKIWGEAFDKQVFITSQQNLMAILRMIQIAWRQYAQTENQKKVFTLAEELLKRVGEFIKRFDRIGKDIDTLHKDYGEAYNKAYTGRQSIVQKANELKDLGVKESTNQPIPMVKTDLLDVTEESENE